MDEQQLQLQFMQYLVQKAVQQLGQEWVQQSYQEFQQALQQQGSAQPTQEQQMQYAKKGAKLNYLKQLRGECPEGYEMGYYRNGGNLCKKCMKKQQEGGEIEESDNPMDKFRAGGKKKACKGTKLKFQNGAKLNPKKKFLQDEATSDSIKANKYNDQEVQATKPGNYRQKNGKTVWVPDRTKAPYNKKK